MRWHILAVDDDPDIGRQIKELLQGRIKKKGDEIVIHTLQNFDDALGTLDTMLYDIIILDVFKGEPIPGNPERAGEDILLDIKKRCFIPVIFYTALPARVQQYSSNLVRVVHKTTGGIKNLRNEVIEVLKTGLPGINRCLIEHFRTIQAKYMWEFVEPIWKKICTVEDSKSLAYLLSRRLAWSLTRENIHSLIGSLGGAAVAGAAGDLVHPVEYYIYPPIGDQYNSGDIISMKKKEMSYWIILTPSCDMYQRDAGKVKSEYVLIARCCPVSKTDEGKKWQQDGSADAKGCLTEFMRNNKKAGQKERYYFLPGTFFLPSLFVDFQILVTVPFDDLKKFEKVATLDSPFAECTLNRFWRYIGRIGTPDLNPSEIDSIIDNLKKRKKKK